MLGVRQSELLSIQEKIASQNLDWLKEVYTIVK